VRVNPLLNANVSVPKAAGDSHRLPSVHEPSAGQEYDTHTPCRSRHCFASAARAQVRTALRRLRRELIAGAIAAWAHPHGDEQEDQLLGPIAPVPGVGWA
jgi:hypothetical protein